MAITRHTVTLRTENPDGAPLEGLWTLVIVAVGNRLLDGERNVLVTGGWSKATTAGVTDFSLPALPQPGIIPDDAAYRLVFDPVEGKQLVTETFLLDRDKTLVDLMTLSGLPITPSVLAQAVSARDRAEFAAATAESAEAVATLARDAASGHAANAQSSATLAGASADAASGSATAAATARTGATGARDAAQAAQTAAETAQQGAQVARTGAETARDAASGHSTTASTHQTAAETARTGAEAAQAGAAASAISAQTARTGAEAARDAAAASAEQAAQAGSLTDHGVLTGLEDDDHPQYLTDARGDVRYVGATDARLSDARPPTAHNHDDRYLTEAEVAEALTGKASTSDLTTHAADTTGVHGIADTSALVVTTDSRLSDARTPTAHNHDDRYYTETETDAALAAKAGTYMGPMIRKWVSGRYYGDETTMTTVSPPLNLLILKPLWVPHAVSIDRIGVTVFTAAASSVARLGFYGSTADDQPSALLLEAGLVDCSGTSGEKDITVSLPLSAGLYWTAIVMQGATTVMRAVNGPLLPVADTLHGSSPLNSYYNTGVTGALPEAITSTPATGGNATRVRVRAA